MENTFVHLHNHTEYSLLDGGARMSVMIKQAKKHGMPAIAITDHGNMYGTYKFYKECKKQGIKAIIGCEVYMVDDIDQKNFKEHKAHFVLLCKNNAGYINLCKLNTIAWTRGFYGKPRIDYNILAEHSDGLIALSACLGGHIPHYLMKGMYDEAKKYALRCKEIFGPDFYIELQDHGMPEQAQTNPLMIKMSAELDIPLVATNDIHYVNREDAEMQDVLMCVEMKKTIDDPDRMRFPGSEFYLKSATEMQKLFGEIAPTALSNTVKIAEQCDCHPFARADLIPVFDNDAGIDNATYLRRLVENGLRERYGEITTEIQARYDHEFNMIDSNGFTDYFLIVWDLMKFANDNNIAVGPGRGSGAGSIIAYALNITKLDPFRYNLLFERFLHNERVSMPDFDLDFCYIRRGEIIEYVRNRYGNEKFCQIVTFGSLAAKAAIKDVGRVFKIPYTEVDKITKPMQFSQVMRPPMLPYIFDRKEILDPREGSDWADKNEMDQEKILDAYRKDKAKLNELKNRDLIELYNTNEDIQKIVDIAIKIEGFPRNCSTHACGVIVCKEIVGHVTPLQRNGEDITTQFDMKEVEELGMLKLDFLGLITLTDINMTLAALRADHGVELDFYDRKTNINAMGSPWYDDPEVYKMLSEGDSDAVFQCETGGFKKFLKDLKPETIEDIIAAVALYRPGPMDMIPDYCKSKNDRTKTIKYDHPMLEPILKATYGAIIYQEQVMDIFRVMGGYSLGQADMVRRVMGKKIISEMDRHKQIFVYGDEKMGISGAMAKGVKKDVAVNVFNKMAKFAGYAFNKSHAACYAYISYQTAYLKRYYYPYYMASVLNHRVNKWDVMTYYIVSIRSSGTEVLPPDINKSQTYFTVEKTENGDAIRFGLGALKNVGTAVIENIIATRTGGGPFTSFQNFCKRVDATYLNKKVLDSLILSGAFDAFGKRSQLLHIYPAIIRQSVTDKRAAQSGQMSLFNLATTETAIEEDVALPDMPEFDDFQKLKYEKDIVGIYLSGHPLESYSKEFEKFTFDTRFIARAKEGEDEVEEEHAPGFENNTPIIMGAIITGIKRLKTKATSREMAVLQIEDMYGGCEVMLFPAIYDKVRHRIEQDMVVQIRGKLSMRDGEDSIILADDITPIHEEPSPTPSATTLSKEKATEVKSMIDDAMGATELWLRYNAADKHLHGDINVLLHNYRGDDLTVMIRNISNGQLINHNVKIRKCEAVVKEIIEKIGSENVKFR
ncbi:MAG: DNA polymerase III subunit alpha [Firmicutes bacterium]|nr:DNA polymerase III subunit alpha [Bacillota bacterium]